MPSQIVAIIDRLRQPEHTGENRCVPCTAVNVVLALVASAVVAVRSRRLASLTVGVSLLAIYLRGYLVPGTPALTSRYLPDEVLAAFDKGPREPRTGTTIEMDDADEATETGRSNEADDEEKLAYVDEIERQRENAVDPEQFLLDVEAVGPCDHADDLCLTDAFADRVEDELDRHRGTTADDETIADLFDVEEGAVTIKDRDYPAAKIGRRVHKWPADAALVADVAVHHALREQTDRWEAVPRGQRLELLEVLRSFLETCPDCGGTITLGEETTESCCRSYEVLALECVDCDAPLLEFDPTEIGGVGGGIEP
ncbi:hypothetical protein GS429_01670 [Natronorubrum sp. JWXQ-INN-674]|uniref:Uncharacterized protein n=1 Tax=Natronorubrum halalkaliphilum TaxID=2691917 RepID=A0A6B0VJM8_9EURY|nr:hypothetical protein [Natronorubrum halalkaliphilum]MXV60799.1 hypothetical protein [Natronorubrum halalkaliphilum]